MIKLYFYCSIIDIFKYASPCQGNTLITQTAAFNPSNYTTKNLKVDDVERLKECFDVFDYDGSGSISSEELLTTVKALGMESQASLLLSIISSSGHTGDMDFASFLEVFGFSGDGTSELTLESIFGEFDKEGKGTFGPEDFDRVAKEVGEHFSITEVEEMIDYADKNRDEVIDYEEFLEVVNKDYGQKN